MITDIERMIRCLEYLKEHDISVHRHFSPYAESGQYESGSALHMFWSDDNIYRFLFDKEDKFTVIPDLSKSTT